MIVPEKFTNYKLNDKGLQEYALFCLMVFNKNANQTAVKLDRFLKYCHHTVNEKLVWDEADCVYRRHPPLDHFGAIKTTRSEKRKSYRWFVENFRFGNTSVKSDGLQVLVSKDIDLRTCTPEELETIPGFGMKTSRFFILHTRPDAQVACLDTHILEWLSYYTGHDVRKSPSKNKYLELEKVFLRIAAAMDTTPADLDLKIWNKQRGTDEESLARSTQT